MELGLPQISRFSVQLSLHKRAMGYGRYGVEINIGENAIEIKNIRGFIIGQVFPQAANFLPKVTRRCQKED